MKTWADHEQETEDNFIKALGQETWDRLGEKVMVQDLAKLIMRSGDLLPEYCTCAVNIDALDFHCEIHGVEEVGRDKVPDTETSCEIDRCIGGHL